MRKFFVLLILLISLVGCSKKLESNQVEIVQTEDSKNEENNKKEFEVNLGDDIKAFKVDISILKEDGNIDKLAASTNIGTGIDEKNLKLKFGFEIEGKNFKNFYEVLNSKEEKLGEGNDTHIGEDDIYDFEENSFSIITNSRVIDVNQAQNICIIAKGIKPMNIENSVEQLKEQGAEKAFVYTVTFYDEKIEEKTEGSATFSSIN